VQYVTPKRLSLFSLHDIAAEKIALHLIGFYFSKYENQDCQIGNDIRRRRGSSCKVGNSVCDVMSEMFQRKCTSVVLCFCVPSTKYREFYIASRKLCIKALMQSVWDIAMEVAASYRVSETNACARFTVMKCYRVLSATDLNPAYNP
jgi:hypothetical protein